MVEIKRILLPTDFSDLAAPAVDYACGLAEKFGSELHLLHVFEEFVPTVPVPGVPFPPPHSHPDEVIQAAAQQLAKMVDPQWQQAHTVVRATRQGSAFVEIIRYARENGFDLIVMGTHGRTGLKHAIIGSVTERVVRKAPCAVLTVRPAEHKFEMP